MRRDTLFRGPTSVGLSAFLCALVMTPIANGGRIVIDSFNEPSPGSNFFMLGPSPGGANPQLFEHPGLTEAETIGPVGTLPGCNSFTSDLLIQ